MMKFLIFSFFCALPFLGYSNSLDMLDINFDLSDHTPQRKNCRQIGPQLDDSLIDDVFDTMDPRYWKADKDTIYIVLEGGAPPVSYPTEMRVFGMTGQEALVASQNAFEVNGCSTTHIHGDLANRWCHTAIARTFSAMLEEKGVSPVLASLAGGLFWAPKEFFIDQNSSPHDLTFTYSDRLGTKSTSFEVTVFGDTFSEDSQNFFRSRGYRMGRTTPFITIRRKL